MPERGNWRLPNKIDLRAINDSMNSIALAQSGSGVAAIRQFADFCLMPGANFKEPIKTAPGVSPDVVITMAAFIRAFYFSVLNREAPHHNQWGQFAHFTQVCTAKALLNLPPEDGRLLVFERTVGHSALELVNLWEKNTF
jgi:hypothetical protein